MDRDELEHVLELQNVAFRLVLWLNEQARRDSRRLCHQEINEIRHGHSCLRRVEAWQAEVPEQLRVDAEDRPAVANLFAAYLQTSFRCCTVRVHCNGPTVPQLLAASPTRKARSEAAALERIALKILLADEGLPEDAARIEALVHDKALQGDLVLWAYAVELVRRSKFASQGQAVHYLWKQLDPKGRRRLKADEILAARGRLLTALTGNLIPADGRQG